MATIIRGSDSLDSKTIQEPPVFRIKLSSDTFFVSGVWTKVPLDSLDVDTDSSWDASNYRWIPNTAGWYQCSMNLMSGGGSTRAAIAAMRKNGQTDSYTAPLFGQAFYYSDVDDIGLNSSSLVYMNGTTDYLEMWTYLYDPSAGDELAFDIVTNFSAHLVRAD